MNRLTFEKLKTAVKELGERSNDQPPPKTLFCPKCMKVFDALSTSKQQEWYEHIKICKGD